MQTTPTLRAPAPSARIKIVDFRRAIESLVWNRSDLTGATAYEFTRMNVRNILTPHINEVTRLLPLVPARFSMDVERAHKAIASARDCIARWANARANAQITALAGAGRLYEVTYEATGTSDDAVVRNSDYSDEECRGFTEVLHAEGQFPDNILALRAASSHDSGTVDGGPRRATMRIHLLVEATDSSDAINQEHQIDLLTRITDAVTAIDGRGPLALDGPWRATIAQACDQPAAMPSSRRTPVLPSWHAQHTERQ